MRARMLPGVLALVTLAGAPVTTLVAQAAPKSTARPAAALDRAKPPTPAPVVPLKVPAWTRATLPNGAELVVVERHDLPLVAVSVSFVGGANQFEAAEKRGLAGLTAGMMREGTTALTGDQLADSLQILGPALGINVGGESGTAEFVATTKTWVPTLGLLVDMLAHPTFPAPALERNRARTLVNLARLRDQGPFMADRVFSTLVYTGAHPYGRAETEASIKAITRDDLVAFHQQYFKPGRAIVTVAGDVTPAEARRQIEQAFAQWPAGGERPTFEYPATPAPKATTIYVVDKPGAAQSSIAIGLAGPPRSTPDYYALQLLNAILGGTFQSRLNMNLREEKGYSYGVRSNFAYGRGPGPFRATGEVTAGKTDSSLIEFMKELKGVQGGRPFTEEEIARAKRSLIQGLPRNFGSLGAVTSAVTLIYANGLAETYWQDYARNVESLTSADLERVAKQYIDMDHLAIVVVGDRKTIEPQLAGTKIAPVVALDADAMPVTTAGTTH